MILLKQIKFLQLLNKTEKAVLEFKHTKMSQNSEEILRNFDISLDFDIFESKSINNYNLSDKVKIELISSYFNIFTA